MRRGLFHVTHLIFIWETRGETSAFPSLCFGSEKIWTFSAPAICLLSSSLTNLLLDQAAVGERRSESLSRCVREAEVAFSWLRAQRRGLVFPAVSDCSRPVECKHALMCGAALDTADTAQAHLRPMRFEVLAWPIVPLFLFFSPPPPLLFNSHPLSQAPYSTTTGSVKLIFYNTFCLS